MLSTRLTRALDIRHPVLSAPMAFAAGGGLAAAVSDAGGLGLVGCGYGDPDWMKEQFAAAGDTRVGCGFITWSVADRPEILDIALEHKPVAIFLSFGDPGQLSSRIKTSGTRLIIQVQSLDDARRALDHGADILVAQGAEAGGHGQSRATMTLVPEIADLLAGGSPETLLCAAGGISDGRGLAASLMLGADGVVMGSRFWAATEALVHPNMHAAATAATGDETIRSSVMDIVRNRNWPGRYTARVLNNSFTKEWHGREQELAALTDQLGPRWETAWRDGDTAIANTFVGEAVGMIATVEPAADLLNRTIQQAEKLLAASQANAGRPFSAV